MRYIATNRKGQGFVWLYVLILLFIVGSLFLILDKVLGFSVVKLGPTIEGTQFEGTGNKINFIWSYLLVVVVLILFIWAVIQAQRRPGYGGY